MTIYLVEIGYLSNRFMDTCRSSTALTNSKFSRLADLRVG